MLGVAIIVFVLLRVVPGDPIAMMIPPGATPADIAALRAHYGLDTSLPTQFFVWLRRRNARTKRPRRSSYQIGLSPPANVVTLSRSEAEGFPLSLAGRAVTNSDAVANAAAGWRAAYDAAQLIEDDADSDAEKPKLQVMSEFAGIASVG